MAIKNQEITTSGSISRSEILKHRNYYFGFLTSTEKAVLLNGMEKDTLFLHKISDSSSRIKEYIIGKGKPPHPENDRIDKVFNSKTN